MPTKYSSILSRVTQYSDALAIAAVEGEATLVLATDPLTLTNGNIAFPAVAVDDAGANVLDDYEEGTFAPTLQDASLSDAEAQTYTTQIGRYVKIGNHVFISITIEVNSLGTLTTTDAANLAGFPFTMITVASLEVAFNAARALSLAIGASESIGGILQSNTAYLAMQKWDAVAGTTAMLISEWSAGGLVTISGFYQVA